MDENGNYDGGSVCVHAANRTSRSQSRMRGDYLYYEEKIETTQEEKDAKAARRFVWMSTLLSLVINGS